MEQSTLGGYALVAIVYSVLFVGIPEIMVIRHKRSFDYALAIANFSESAKLARKVSTHRARTVVGYLLILWAMPSTATFEADGIPSVVPFALFIVIAVVTIVAVASAVASAAAWGETCGKYRARHLAKTEAP